jgi:hypothetical protein
MGDRAVDPRSRGVDNSSFAELDLEQAPRVLEDDARVGTEPPGGPQERRYPDLLEIPARFASALEGVLHLRQRLEH